MLAHIIAFLILYNIPKERDTFRTAKRKYNTFNIQKNH